MRVPGCTDLGLSGRGSSDVGFAVEALGFAGFDVVGLSVRVSLPLVKSLAQPALNFAISRRALALSSSLVARRCRSARWPSAACPLPSDTADGQNPA